METSKIVGDIKITPISDGRVPGSKNSLRGIDEATVAAMLESRGKPTTPIISINTFLVEAGGKRLLVDTGASTLMGEGAGKLIENLGAAGVLPGDIDIVLLTHIHPDHSAGLITPEGAPAFPEAKILVHQDELAYWTNPDNNSGTPLDKFCFGSAEAAIKANLERFGTFSSGNIVPGVEIVPLPGHTPGHTGYRIGDLLIWGDLMHRVDIQAVWPKASVIYDTNPEQAVETRCRILEECVADNTTVIGGHTDFPSFMKVRKIEDHYILVPID